MTLILTAPYLKKLPSIIASIFVRLGTNATLSEDKLTASVSNRSGARVDHGKIAGKWYWEARLKNQADFSTTVKDALGPWIGVTLNGFPMNNVTLSVLTSTPYQYIMLNASSLGTYTDIYNFKTKTDSQVPAPKQGDVIGIALDMDARTLQFYCNGVKIGVLQTFPAGQRFWPNVAGNNEGTLSETEFNFGASPFAFPVPEGFNPGYYL
jgi:hypothetical protein